MALYLYTYPKHCCKGIMSVSIAENFSNLLTIFKSPFLKEILQNVKISYDRLYDPYDFRESKWFYEKLILNSNFKNSEEINVHLCIALN